MSSPLQLKPTVDTGTFRRYQPFGDRREVTSMRGKERVPDGPFVLGERELTLAPGRSVKLTLFEELVSPPPLRPGQEPMSPEAAAHYHPTYELVTLGGEQLCFRRAPEGFSTEEVDMLVAAFAARPQAQQGG